MELTILGASGTYPTPTMPCSGYLLQHDGFSMYMDAGNGTLAQLQTHMRIWDVDALWLSHAHPDHCADLFPFFYALLQEPDRAPMPVFAAPEVRDRLSHLIGPDSIDLFNGTFDWHLIEPGDVAEVGPLRLEAFEGSHSTPNNALRVEAGGRVFCYSGDSGPAPALPKAAAEANLFLCEASWLESDIGLMAPIHMTAREAGAAGKEAGVERLALTHIWPRNDLALVREQAGETFGADVLIAREIPRFDV